MARNSIKNRYRINHFTEMEQDDLTNYTPAYQVLIDGLIQYPKYHTTDYFNYEWIDDNIFNEEIDKLYELYDIKKDHIIILRLDSPDLDPNITEYIKVYRNYEYEGIMFSRAILKRYKENNQMKLEIFKYLFKNQTIEREFCHILRDNLKLYLTDIEKYNKMVRG